ncbi:MAG: hypothetical protein ACHQX3_08720 [Nitrospirales bacterium]
MVGEDGLLALFVEVVEGLELLVDGDRGIDLGFGVLVGVELAEGVDDDLAERVLLLDELDLGVRSGSVDGLFCFILVLWVAAGYG